MMDDLTYRKIYVNSPFPVGRRCWIATLAGGHVKSVRIALMLVPALSVMLVAADASGTWQVDTSFDDPTLSGGSLSCTFKQEKQTLSGTCRPSPKAGEVTITGDVDGQEVRWQFDVVISPGAPAERAVYTGTLNTAGDAITGTLMLASFRGRFSAIKQ
jgi:hypothetical protein